MSKKRIDELFQEKFRGFEETPDDHVWSAIKASLDKKKKKRVVPIWWQLAGVAAALVIGLLLFNPFDDNKSPETNSVTDVEKKQSNSKFLNDSLNAIENANVHPDPDASKKIDSDTNQNIEESIANSETSNAAKPSKNNVTKSTGNNTSDLLNQTKIAGSLSENQDSEAQNSISSNVLTYSDQQESEIINSDTITTKGTYKIGGETGKKNDEIITLSEKETIASNNEKAMPKNNQGKKSLYDDIKDVEEEEITVAKSSKNKWSAGPSVAPVYFDAMGTGSPVSPMFSANSKSGNINMSYGVSVAYEISPKLYVRSGVHKVDYGYNTNDVYFTSSLAALGQERIANIDYAENAENLLVSSNIATLNVDSKSFDVSARTANRSGVMAQQLGYLEVPVELSYALVNTKFGVHVIGGVSSLFLIENEVDLTSGNLTTQIGEANNVNDLNFSANFGIGLGYQFSQKLKLNIEPVFKYQLNTFSNVDGTFNPYSIGVYSGVSFKF